MANYNYLKYTSSECRVGRKRWRSKVTNALNASMILITKGSILISLVLNFRIGSLLKKYSNCPEDDKREMLSINFKQLCSWKRSSGWGTLPINWWDTGSLVIRWLRYNDPALAAVINWPFTRRPSVVLLRYSAISSGLDKWPIVIDATFKIYIIFTFNAARCISLLYTIEANFERNCYFIKEKKI